MYLIKIYRDGRKIKERIYMESEYSELYDAVIGYRAKGYIVKIYKEVVENENRI